ELAAATGLDLAVDQHQTLDQQLPRIGSAVDQVGELEELTQPDRVVTDRNLVHRYPLPWTRHISTDTVWINTPTRPPTMVPLIRMNCRSRPTCSSILSAASLPSQRSIVWVMTAASSSPYLSMPQTAKSASQRSIRERSAVSLPTRRPKSTSSCSKR